jgi:ABC-type polysaccharide/polyol phosphate transport system ATPase subunit
MTGFIGPNGAGKSTTIKVLISILTPAFGNVFNTFLIYSLFLFFCHEAIVQLVYHHTASA